MLELHRQNNAAAPARFAQASCGSGPSRRREHAPAYGIGACVGRGSVIGFGVGSVGAVDGEGDGLTVFTDGPALVVSPIRVGVLVGKNIAIKTITAIAAKKNGAMLISHSDEVRTGGSIGSNRGSPGL